MDVKEREGALLLAEIMRRAGKQEREIAWAISEACSYGVLGCMTDDIEEEPGTVKVPARGKRGPEVRERRRACDAERVEVLRSVVGVQTVGEAARRVGLRRNAAVIALVRSGFRDWADFQARTAPAEPVQAVVVRRCRGCGYLPGTPGWRVSHG